MATVLSAGKWTPARHLKLIDDLIVGAFTGKISRLIIELPPRHGKSEFVSKWTPVWWLNERPTDRIGLATYEATFAASWGRKARNLIAEHTDRLTVEVAGDSSAANEWQTSDGGGMSTAGIGGPWTGKGFQLLVIDDPIKNAEEANSQVIRDKQWEWFTSTAYTRLEPGGVIIILMTRWHEDDLVGRILAQMADGGERWEVVRLPAIAEDNDPIGRRPGEALWPERYSVADLDRIRATVGEHVWASLFQQHPRQPGGAIYKQDWWTDRNRFDATDQRLQAGCIARWQTWDIGNKTGANNAYTACVTLELLADYRLVVRDVWRDRIEFTTLPATIQALAEAGNRDGKLRGVIIEDKANGTPAIQTLRSAGPPWLRDLIIDFMPSGDKEQRARQSAVWCALGCVLLPHPSEAVPWLHAFTAELWAFPQSTFKDQADALGQGIIYLEHLIADGWRARENRGPP